MQRLGLITCTTIEEPFQSTASPLITYDDIHLVHALEQRGIQVEPIVWRNQDPHQVTCDAYLVRTPWDYHLDAEKFLQWLEALEKTGVQVAHDAALLRWNTEKTYLADLAQRGARVIPTRYVDHTEPLSLLELAKETGWDEVVLKPVVAGGGIDTYRLKHEEMAAFEAKHQALLAQKAMMLQPFLPEVLEEGEWSLIFFDGEYSHSVRKQPKIGEFRVQDKHGGRTSAATAPHEMRNAAKQILDSVSQRLLYARVDGIQQPDGFTLIELEIFEPELFFRLAPGAAERFAEILQRWFGQ